MTELTRPANPHALAWTLGILAAPLVYVLSIGPVIFLTGMGVIPDPWPTWLVYFYHPVVLLELNTPLEGPMETYFGWCAEWGAKF